MLSISMFNNKGGVGKTTLTCNIAAFFARERNKRVLVVDCDPQCNSTQLIMGQQFTTDFYWSKTPNPDVTSIKDVLQPIEDGDSGINRDIMPVLSSKNRFGVDILPGHPGFSIIEDRLGSAWHDLQGGDLGGIRKTNWNTELCAVLDAKYDIAFFDLGPSLGSINRTVLVGCNKFITPMGCDIFSILGIRNIAEWLSHWLRRYQQGLSLCEEASPGRLDGYKIRRILDINAGYGGFTMQQYITKSKGGVRRPTKAYEEIINYVPEEIDQSLGTFFTEGLDISKANMGDVPHLYSLIPLAQSVSAPILELKSGDGLVGAQFKQREEYGGIIAAIADRLANNLRME
jgi:cellulose biosynthesis protein BcsQ